MKSLFSARSHMFHFPARVIAIGFLGIAAPDAAFGADPAACAAYAERSVQQQQENLQRECGFQSLRWNNNGPAAYLFCMSVGEDLAGAETVFRDQKLAECRAAQGDGQAQANNNNAGQPQGENDGGALIQGTIIEPEPTLQVNQPFGGQQGQPESGQDEVYEDVVIGAQATGNGTNCQIAIGASGEGSTLDEAKADAQSNWEQLATQQFGANFSYFPGANGATFYCGGKNGVHTCTAVGGPCNNIKGIGSAENDVDAHTCKDQAVGRERWFPDETNENNIQRWMKGNWEFEVAQKYGAEFARFDNAANPTFHKNETRNGHTYYLNATPCTYPNRPRPVCVAPYRMYEHEVKFVQSPTFEELWAEWSRRVAILYGADYADIENSIQRKQDRVYNGQTPWLVLFPFFIPPDADYVRYVQAQGCLARNTR